MNRLRQDATKDDRGGGPPDTLLGARDPPPVEIVNPRAPPRWCSSVTHASNRVPAALGTLGLPPEALGRHIGWDIGAGAIARRLAAHFDAPAVLSGYSRLVIDCNRAFGDEQSIPAVSDGTEVPGNRDVTTRDAAARMESLLPAIPRGLRRDARPVEACGRTPPVLIMHSFTPALAGGEPRPWHVGILWNRDGRIALPLLRLLRARGDLCVGDNQPYNGASPRGYTMPAHAARHGRAGVQIEVRQDLLADEAGIERWTGILSEALAEVFEDPSLYERHAG